MEIKLGTSGLENSWQKDFPSEVKCGCGGIARIAFTAIEKNGKAYVCHLHENEGKGGFWPHDAIAVAVYFCKECFEATILWNQA